ncbi:MAG: hypothetical protein ACOWWM_17185 [Desulfobacterales bacterium]
MQDITYRLILTGTVQEGYDLEAVKTNTARLFKLPAKIVDFLYGGGEQVVKKRGSRKVCEKIKAALDHAGAVSRIEMEPIFKLEPRLDHPYFQQRRSDHGAFAAPPR